MRGGMTLALAIPVHNDAEGLRRLLRQVSGFGCFDQVVIVDDASEEPVGADLVPAVLQGRTVMLRNDTSGGAGQARNRALEAVLADRVLFFDADDLFTEEFPWLWHELSGQDFDFCLFKHHDSRVLARGGWGQMPQDNALWRLAGTASGGMRQVTGQALAYLAETANYPWNKIYRTGFLREHGLRFAEVPLHNDIAVHWDSFSCAAAAGGRVLTSDRVAATHFVQRGGQRLTNRRSQERLRLFGQLDHARAGIRARQGEESALMLALMRFSCGLIDWARGNIAEEFWGRFDRQALGYLDVLLEGGKALDWVARAEPVLALRMLLMMARRGQVA